MHAKESEPSLSAGDVRRAVSSCKPQPASSPARLAPDLIRLAFLTPGFGLERRSVPEATSLVCVCVFGLVFLLTTYTVGVLPR